MPFVETASSSDQVSVFDNGMDVDRVDWIRDGTINALGYSRAGAAEFGVPVAVGADNLLMTGGTSSLDDMVAGTERGLLLTTLWYIRVVDPGVLLLTGLTRDGVYLVENGQITRAVNNFRFNESPLDLLRRVSEAGVSEVTLPREWGDWATRAQMPSLRIPDFHMSSVSQAQYCDDAGSAERPAGTTGRPCATRACTYLVAGTPDLRESAVPAAAAH